MGNINELVELAQQLNTAMLDNKSVISMDISTTRGESIKFLVGPGYILENFENVDVIKRKGKDIPFKLEAEIEGVVFETYVCLDEVEFLRGHIPNEWIDEVTKLSSSQHTDRLKIKKAD